MFFELFIALRYIWSKKKSRYMSFISMSSLAGVALGVASLIVILSVMNGLETELKSRLINMKPHATISNKDGIEYWENLSNKISTIPGVTRSMPFVSGEAVIGIGDNLKPVIIQGIEVDQGPYFLEDNSFFISGDISNLQPYSNRIAVGYALAYSLGLDIGDSVNIMIPSVEGGIPSAKIKTFLLAGIFEAGVLEHDSSLAIMNISDASILKGLRGVPTTIGIYLDQPLSIANIQDQLLNFSRNDYVYSDWSIENRSYFNAIKIEKIMMTLLLGLIVAVATFNIVASLVMFVTDKETDIAILKTLGIEKKSILKIFILQGSIVGISGIIAGNIIGLFLAINAENIFPWLEKTFNFNIMPSDVFYISVLPSEVRVFDIVLISVISIFISVISTIYPSYRAASVLPIDSLRYE
ncbi:MAG: lipoprotein-releasing system transmembrane subunit LolC [Gammaproteobacteria bacterium]|nr:lipoprotein-releasing system transmembrane subunit LolC [Gammaproteobacteria bacterium]